jgi:archaellum component FlaC
MDSMDKPIISRHGTKGGRFIDGMFTCMQGIEKITGISIINDTGINSDHAIVITKIDLGVDNFRINNQREKRIDFRSIMNIPVHKTHGDKHPKLNTMIYKGADFRQHAVLYDQIQRTVQDTSNDFMTRLTNIHQNLYDLEKRIITHTKETISKEDQDKGVLIKRTVDDAMTLNIALKQFFNLLNDVFREVGLAKMTPILPSVTINEKKKDVISGKIMPGVTLIAITKQIDDPAKRARCMVQRVNILLKSIIGTWIRNNHQKDKVKRTEAWIKDITTNLRRLSIQQSPLYDSMMNTIRICNELKEERMNHIMSIESKQNRKIYDNGNMFIDEVVERQGKEVFAQYINNIKKGC